MPLFSNGCFVFVIRFCFIYYLLAKVHCYRATRKRREHNNMDIEIKNFTKVWLISITSLFYCYYIAARFPRGIRRLFSLLPVIYLFTILPFDLSSFHLGAPTIFYLVWLGNFKLLLFAFNKGPLSPNPPLSLRHFTSIALLPIKTKQPLTDKNNPNPDISTKVQKQLLLATKVVIFTIVIRAYEYRQKLHPYIIL